MRVKLIGASITAGVTVIHGARDIIYSGIDKIEIENSEHNATITVEHDRETREIRVIYGNIPAAARECVLSVLA